MTTPISRPTLQSFLFGAGYGDVRAPDLFYALPSEAWIAGAFADSLRREQQSRGIGQYVTVKNNCTKFSRHAAWYAAYCHFLTHSEQTESAALAFGTFDFIRPDDTAHSINIAVTRNLDQALWLVFFEPQVPQIVPEPQRKENTPCIISF